MATTQIGTVLRHFRQVVLARTQVTDGQLLDDYLIRREEAAFEALVRRHGRMVMGVCRRVLRNAHDAEDAFQATFLVLVRKATSIRPRERVGNWLHGVAYRTALKAKSAAVKRQARDAMTARPEAIPASEPNDWQVVLDQELLRLPQKYRAPVLLCDVEGKTRKQAARQLGWAEGTLSTRLTRARDILVQRLSSRGVTLPAAGLAAALTQNAAAAVVPPSLVTAAIHAQRLIGLVPTGGAIPATVIALVEGVLKSMALKTVKRFLLIGLAASCLFGLGIGSYQSLPAKEPPAERTPPPVQQASHAVEELPLPTGPMPYQGLVKLDDKGRVVVTLGVSVAVPKTQIDAAGIPTTSYAFVRSVETRVYHREQVRVFDTRGNKIKSASLPQLLKKPLLALVVHGPDDPDPLYSRLIKDGTLIFQVPSAPPAPIFVPPSPVSPGQPIHAFPAGTRVPAPAPTLVPEPAPAVQVRFDSLGEVKASGPGRVLLMSQGGPDFAPGSAVEAKGSAPQAGAAPIAKKSTLTRIDFLGNMFSKNKDNVRTSRFYGVSNGVEVYSACTHGPDADMDPDHPPKNGFYMRCDALTVHAKALGQGKSAQFLQFEGGVMFKSEQFLGYASVVKYDQSQEAMTFEGKPGNPAKLYQLRPPLEPRFLQGEKVRYNRRTGEVKMDGVSTLKDVPFNR